MIMEENNRWTYLPLEAIPAEVAMLKKATGLPVRLVEQMERAAALDRKERDLLEREKGVK